MRTKLPPVDVAVIGAGLAGLSAADGLAGAGRSVVVFEGRDRVGGRAYSVADDGGAIDLGATWTWADEAVVRDAADRLGVDTFAQYIRGDALFEQNDSGAQRLAGNPIDVPSHRFSQGAQALAHRLADRLPPGTLRLGDRVSAVTRTPGGFRVDSDSASLLAGDVVVAAPPAVAVEQIAFEPQLPADFRVLAERTAVWMGGVVKAVAVYDHAFWRSAGLAGSAISYTGPFQEFHDHSGPGGSPPALFAFAPAARFAQVSQEEMDSVFAEQLVRLFGPAAAEPTSTRIVDWSRERFTAPTRPSPQASTATFGATAFQRAVHNGIHWASTETATAYAGHLEGALRAGVAVVDSIRRTRSDRDGD